MREYSVISHPRKSVIFVLAVISVFSSHFIASWFIWFRGRTGIESSFTFSALTIFGILYYLFNRWVWKWTVAKVLHFPNLTGEWISVGTGANLTTGQDYSWQGTIQIKQTWDKIHIVQTNESSTSESLTCAIQYSDGIGYIVSYYYSNTPKMSAKELRRHDGFSVLTFSDDLSLAEGYYFNNIKDRMSYGEIKLTRR